jgi:cytosine/adenosine deaminase-related metal-dependent hydrolase
MFAADGADGWREVWTEHARAPRSVRRRRGRPARTAEGAGAAGLGDTVGELRPGRQADLLVLDTSGPHWLPRRASWVETVIAAAMGWR